MASPASIALFDQFARGWRGYVLIALVALVSGFMGATRVPVTDIDEARFAQTTRQLIEGDAQAGRNGDPPGMHWLQAASVNTLQPVVEHLNTIWPYRAPSVLGLVLASLATLWAGSALFGPRTGFVAAAIFSVGMLASAEGMLAKPDAMATGFTTLALAALAQLRSGTARPRIVASVFWLALACGVLIKGPLAPLIAGFALLALALWERRIDWMKPLTFWLGPILAIAIALPWLTDIGAYTDAFSAENRQAGMPGSHLLWLPLLIFPATYALPAAVRLGWSAVRAPRNDSDNAPFRLLIAWAAPLFIFFELMPVKLFHFTLPAYPAIALMCAAGLFAMRGKRWRITHPAGLVMFGVFGALIVALMAVVSTFMPGHLADAGLRRAIAAAVIGATTIAAAIAGLMMLRRPTVRAAVLVMCALALSFSLRERLLPEAHRLFISNEAAATLTRARLMPQQDQAFWIVGYEQPSIVFQTRSSVRMVEIGDLAQTPIVAGDGMIVEGRVFDQVQAALGAKGLEFEALDEPARGMAMGRGEYMTLHMGRAREISAAPSAAPPPNP